MGGVAQEVGGAYFVEGLPVLGFVHWVRLKKKCFRAFVLIFFSPNVPSPSRPKCACTNRYSFLRKRWKTVGNFALGPYRRGLCFHPGISWFSRGPSELGKVLSEKNGKIRVSCRKT